MSKVVVSSDTHLGHKRICTFRTEFSTVEEHDDFVIEKHKLTIGKRDTWYCLGDVAFTKEALLRFKEINCAKKILVLGNHCTEYLSIQDLLEVFDEIHSSVRRKLLGKKYILSHIPIHRSEFRSASVNIHGHLHFKTVQDNGYINVCCEHTEYGAIPVEKLLLNYREKSKWLIIKSLVKSMMVKLLHK